MNQNTVTMRPIQRIELTLFGPTNLTNANNIQSLLDSLESKTIFTPNFASDDECKNQEYDRDRCIKIATNPTLKYGGYIHIKRTKAAKYTGYFSYGATPFISITFDPKLAKKNYLQLLEWSQTLVEAFKPDYASLSFRQQYEDIPWPTKIDESLNRFSYFCISHEGSYYSKGPPGIGMFTWFSDYVTYKIGSDYLYQTPNLNIDKQNWGGYFLSLSLDKHPWDTEPQALVDTWYPAMQHLSKTGLFYEQFIENDVLQMRKGISQIPYREVENYKCQFPP